MPKVFPIQQTKFPINSAREFGDLQPPIFTDTTYPTGKAAGQGAADLRDKKCSLAQDADAAMDYFDPATDFLLIIGDPIFIGIAFAVARDIAIEQNFCSINVLRYDKALGRYLDIEVGVQ
jgi:hypothetical protein